VPLHFTRFQPQYMMKTLPPTPVETLEMARDIALAEGLHYVYMGNVSGHPGEHTYCPACKTVLIRRSGFRISLEAMDNGVCRKCGYRVPGIWS
jgi:pyruvate formate lyase activating enzyme